ncbi:MAG TPA: hypothetical protein PKX92_12405 [Edaphocola sp.]|nr:hypothetical protein [Edaphocola sp.]
MIGKLSISPWGKTAQRALVWAYDCFPFGMLMPDRYISDTSDHCMTISRSNWTTEMADTCKPLATLASTGIFSAGSSISTSGSSIVLHAEEYDSWIQLTTEVEAGIDNRFSFDVPVLEGAAESGMQVMIIETRDNTPYVIGGGYLMPGGRKQTISFNASGNTVNLLFNGPFSTAEIEQICTHYTKTTQQSYLVEVCDDAKDKYRFGWQGKFEKINEISGSGNHIDWGGYGYDSRLARRWSPDKLQAKYSWQSPYSALGNNPILNQEIDGKDYAVFVDHKTKTVIVKATYYTAKGNTDDHNSAVQATQFWNEQSGKYQYKVGKGKKAVYYDINFQLDVQQVDKPTAEANKDRASFVADIEKLTPDMSSNTYEVVPDAELDATTNGKTTVGAAVKVKESRKETGTGAHELGHTLGFKHLIGSIMSEASNVGRSETTNTTIIGQILKNAGLGRKNYHRDYQGGGTGHLQPSTGTAPPNFDRGKVVKKK